MNRLAHVPMGDRGPIRGSSRRHRLRPVVERVEDRIVPSNVVVTYTQAPFPAISITGDIGNANFHILENTDGTITVSQGDFRTTIDGSTSFTSPVGSTVLSISAVLNGTTNTDIVSLSGPGKSVMAGLKSVAISAPGGANLNLSVSNLQCPGSFTLTQTATPGILDGALHATLDNSSFGSLTIAQSGASPALVELGNVIVPGPVSISEGVGHGSQILADAPVVGGQPGSGDAFGPTTLVQGAGAAVTGSDGSNDVVSLTGASVASLTITQDAASPSSGGSNESISVNGLKLGLTSLGLTTTQGDGANDTITIDSVVAYGSPSSGSLLLAAPTGISVTQGQGMGDAARVTNSTLPGNMSIVQGDGDGDSALFSKVQIGYTVSVGGAILQGFPADLSIRQGGGTGDTANVTDSTTVGQIAIAQLDGAGDVALILGSTAGYTLSAGPYVLPQFGDASISQGNGYADQAVFHQDTVNQVSITQGNNLFTPSSTPPNPGVAQLTGTAVAGDINITQGDQNAVGYYVASLGYDALGSYGSSPVKAGGATSIVQNGGNNSVNLGDPAATASSFSSTYLDVNTGQGGEGLVSAREVSISYGSSTGKDFVIDGGGTGNTLVDYLGNVGLTFSANYNDIQAPPPTPPANVGTGPSSGTNPGGTGSGGTSSGGTGSGGTSSGGTGSGGTSSGGTGSGGTSSGGTGSGGTSSGGTGSGGTSSGGTGSGGTSSGGTGSGGTSSGGTGSGGTSSGGTGSGGTSSGGTGSGLSSGGSASTQGTSPGSNGQSDLTPIPLVVRVVRIHRRSQIRVFNATTGALRFSILPFGKMYKGRVNAHLSYSQGSNLPLIVAQTHPGPRRYVTRVFSALNGTVIPGKRLVSVSPSHYPFLKRHR